MSIPTLIAHYTAERARIATAKADIALVGRLTVEHMQHVNDQAVTEFELWARQMEAIRQERAR